MSLFNLLYTVFITPIQLVFEIIFVIAHRLVGHPALAVIVLSLAMNFLVLPLYRRADAMQEEARDIDLKLRRGVAHIKKNFSGDERMMVLQTYYRQNNYKPTDALKGSVSLLLEIPFFIAAYQFLSHISEFNDVSFGPIADLSAPDGLIVIAGLSINLLPILMTLINLISSAIFLKGFPLKSKIQLYGMALFFLVFLYNSPSGLVFYWTLNNTFSLVKTIFYKIPNPRKVLSILASLTGIAAAAVGILLFGLSRPKMLLAFLMLAIVLQFPLIFRKLKLELLPESGVGNCKPDKFFFTFTSLLITILTGLLIPSAVLEASPLEFINPYYFHNPLVYLLVSGCLAAGAFMLWFRIFYGLANASGKVVFERCLFIVSVVMLVNYMFFGTDLGMISPSLQYDAYPVLPFTTIQQLINLAVIFVLAVICWQLATKKAAWARSLVLTLCLVLAGMSAINSISIGREVSQYKQSVGASSDENVELGLSADGKNVIVLMLDRAYGGFLPYFIEEKPELKETFDGFAWYSNVISFGAHTNFGAPALFGGYEYTPVEINKRSDETLVDKHNEAISVLPVLFSEEGYDVTVCDVPYANYQNPPDLSIYDAYEGIDSYILRGRYMEPEQVLAGIENNYRNFFCFSLVKTAPLFLQDTLYYLGNYNQVRGPYSEQIVESNNLAANGITELFLADHNSLRILPEVTTLSSNEKGSFLMLNNEAPHQVCLLQLPDYEISGSVDNRDIPWEAPVLEGKTLQLDDRDQLLYYHVNMASLLRVGEWLDKLRELDVYDNTRIIIVSDHGNNRVMQDDLIFDEFSDPLDVSTYYPLLMVKDFNSTGFNVSDEFMTNADVATLATENLVDNPINPFTGKTIDSSEKLAHDQYIITSTDWSVKNREDTAFGASSWLSVSDDIMNPNNWTYFEEETLFPAPATE